MFRHLIPHNSKHHENAKKREQVVRAIIKGNIPDDVTLYEVLDATRNDAILQMLTAYISMANLNACKEDPDTKCFSSVFYELSNVNSIILYGQQVVIPASLQE